MGTWKTAVREYILNEKKKKNSPNEKITTPGVEGGLISILPFVFYNWVNYTLSIWASVYLFKMFLWIFPYMIFVGITWGKEGENYIVKCKLPDKKLFVKINGW